MRGTDYVTGMKYIMQKNKKCMLCDDSDTANYILSDYRKVAQNKYKNRHEWVERLSIGNNAIH